MIFYTSHVLDVVERLCDRVIILDHGKIVADGTMDELRRSFANTTLEDIFTRLTHEEDLAPRLARFRELMK